MLFQLIIVYGLSNSRALVRPCPYLPLREAVAFSIPVSGRHYASVLIFLVSCPVYYTHARSIVPPTWPRQQLTAAAAATDSAYEFAGPPSVGSDTG